MHTPPTEAVGRGNGADQDVTALSAAEKRALKAALEANLRGVPRDAGYEGSELMAAKNRPVARKSASSENSCRVSRLCGITAKGGHLEDTRGAADHGSANQRGRRPRDARGAQDVAPRVRVQAWREPADARAVGTGSKQAERAGRRLDLAGAEYPDTLKRLESLAAFSLSLR